MPGDDDGFLEFVAARWPALVRFAHALTGDLGRAEDAVQSALERSWRRWNKINRDGPEAYVRTAIAREVISRHRWRARRAPEVAWDDATAASAQRTPSRIGGEMADRHALRDLVWTELGTLPPRMRAVVVLRIWEDLTEQETAELLGCSVGAVKSQLSRALAKLRERPLLREEFGQPEPLETGRGAAIAGAPLGGEL